MGKPGLSPVTFLLPPKTIESLICDCQVSGLLEGAETLTLFKVVCPVSDYWNYLFKQSLINAQWQEQCHRLIVNQLEGVTSAWGLVTDVQNSSPGVSLFPRLCPPLAVSSPRRTWEKTWKAKPQAVTC